MNRDCEGRVLQAKETHPAPTLRRAPDAFRFSTNCSQRGAGGDLARSACLFPAAVREGARHSGPLRSGQEQSRTAMHPNFRPAPAVRRGHPPSGRNGILAADGCGPTTPRGCPPGLIIMQNRTKSIFCWKQSAPAPPSHRPPRRDSAGRGRRRLTGRPQGDYRTNGRDT